MIHANGLVQMNRLGLADQDPMLVLRSGVLGIIAWVLDDSDDGPHTDQVSGALVRSPEALPRRDDPEAITGQEISKETMIGMPAGRPALGLVRTAILVVNYHVGQC